MFLLICLEIFVWPEILQLYRCVTEHSTVLEKVCNVAIQEITVVFQQRNEEFVANHEAPLKKANADGLFVLLPYL